MDLRALQRNETSCVCVCVPNIVACTHTRTHIGVGERKIRLTHAQISSQFGRYRQPKVLVKFKAQLYSSNLNASKCDSQKELEFAFQYVGEGRKKIQFPSMRWPGRRSDGWGSFFVSCAIDWWDETCMHYRRQYASNSKIISFTIILIDTHKKHLSKCLGTLWFSWVDTEH